MKLHDNVFDIAGYMHCFTHSKIMTWSEGVKGREEESERVRKKKNKKKKREKNETKIYLNVGFFANDCVLKVNKSLSENEIRFLL